MDPLKARPGNRPVRHADAENERREHWRLGGNARPEMSVSGARKAGNDGLENGVADCDRAVLVRAIAHRSWPVAATTSGRSAATARPERLEAGIHRQRRRAGDRSLSD